MMITPVDEIVLGIYRLMVEIPRVSFPFAAYFIKGEAGVLIEPGPAVIAPEVRVAASYLGLSRLDYIIPTHIHLDHAGGVGLLSQLFPQAEVVANPQGAKHVIDPERLVKSTRVAFGEEFEATYGPILPVPRKRLKVVKDGQRLTAGDRELEVIYSPGHARHHIAIYDVAARVLFCGEALGLIYAPDTQPLPAVAAPSLDIEVYLSTMERLRRLKPATLIYSHGGMTDEPDKFISQAAENTRAIGDVVIEELRAGNTNGEIYRRVDEFIQGRFGVGLSHYELTTNVNGFIYYFRKRGLA